MRSLVPCSASFWSPLLGRPALRSWSPVQIPELSRGGALHPHPRQKPQDPTLNAVLKAGVNGLPRAARRLPPGLSRPVNRTDETDEGIVQRLVSFLVSLFFFFLLL